MPSSLHALFEEVERSYVDCSPIPWVDLIENNKGIPVVDVFSQTQGITIDGFRICQSIAGYISLTRQSLSEITTFSGTSCRLPLNPFSTREMQDALRKALIGRGVQIESPHHTGGPLIRPILTDDAAQVMRFCQENAKSLHETGITTKPTEDQSTDVWLAREGGITLGAFHKGKLVGICGGMFSRQVSPAQGDLSLYYTVAPSYEGLGIGAELARETIAASNLAFGGLKRAIIQCFDSNNGSKKIAEKLGMTADDSVGYYVVFDKERVELKGFSMPIEHVYLLTPRSPKFPVSKSENEGKIKRDIGMI